MSSCLRVLSETRIYFIFTNRASHTKMCAYGISLDISMSSKTNTGRKNHEGRTVWQGPRGGLFVQKNGRNVPVFIDHISHEIVNSNKGVRLGGQLYDPAGMQQMIHHGMKFVPHSRAELTREQVLGLIPEYEHRKTHSGKRTKIHHG